MHGKAIPVHAPHAIQQLAKIAKTSNGVQTALQTSFTALFIRAQNIISSGAIRLTLTLCRRKPGSSGCPWNQNKDHAACRTDDASGRGL
jgi:hypothetical protein